MEVWSDALGCQPVAPWDPFLLLPHRIHPSFSCPRAVPWMPRDRECWAFLERSPPFVNKAIIIDINTDTISATTLSKAVPVSVAPPAGEAICVQETQKKEM